MSKHIVESIGDFSYMLGSEYIYAHRPTVIHSSNRLNELVHEKLVRSFDSLPEEACDLEFEKFLKAHDGDVESAVQNYIASLTVEEEATENKISTKPPAKAKTISKK
jgi:hypothetical protein